MLVILIPRMNKAEKFQDFSDFLISIYAPAQLQPAQQKQAEDHAKQLIQSIRLYTQEELLGNVRYGDRIKLIHKATTYFLRRSDKLYVSGNRMVLAGQKVGSWWLVKGPHVQGKRWTGNLWQPLLMNKPFRLEVNNANLHIASNSKAPLSAGQEICLFGSSGVGDENDNWLVTDILDVRELKKNVSVRLQDEKTNVFLTSGSKFRYPDGTQEIYGANDRNDDTWWVIQDIVPGIASDLAVFYATYGDLNNADATKRIIVTDKVDAFVYDGQMRWPVFGSPLQPQTSIFEVLNIQDPIPQMPKNLLCVYRANNALYMNLPASEYDIIAFPSSQDSKIYDLDQMDTPVDFAILFGVYGDLNYTDTAKRGGLGVGPLPLWNVTKKINMLVNDKQILFDATPKSKLFGDPAPGFGKSLFVVYRAGNRIYVRHMADAEAGFVSATKHTNSIVIYDHASNINAPTDFLLDVGEASHVTAGSTPEGRLAIYALSQDSDEVKRYNLYSSELDPWKKFDAKIDAKKSLTSFKDISASSDGLLSVLDGDGKAYIYDGNKKIFKKIAAGYGKSNLVLSEISVGNKYAIWAVDEKAKALYQYDFKRGWVKDQRQAGVYVAAGVDGTVVCIDAEDNAFMYDFPKWKAMPAVKLERVSVGNKDHIWGIDKNRQLLQYINNNWQPVMGKLRQPTRGFKEIAVNAAGAVVALDTEGNVWRKGDAGFQVTNLVLAAPGKKIQSTGVVIPIANLGASRTYLYKRKPPVDKHSIGKRKRARRKKLVKRVVKKAVKPVEKKAQPTMVK